jgi:hypothetical protein
VILSSLPVFGEGGVGQVPGTELVEADLTLPFPRTGEKIPGVTLLFGLLTTLVESI